MTEIEELRNELRESQKRQNEINERLLEMLTNISSSPKINNKIEDNKQITVEINRKSYKGLKQPRPDDMIRI